LAYKKTHSTNDYALILGASSGFGEATAMELAVEGFNILGIHLDQNKRTERVAKIKKRIEEKGVSAQYFNINAVNEAKRKETINIIREKLHPKGKIKVLLHSLEFSSIIPFIHQDLTEQLKSEHLEATMDVMAHSLVFWVQDIFAAKLLSSGSKIFALTSSASVRARPSFGAVSAAKAALEAHVRQLALELAPFEVSVNCIRAGVTYTPALIKVPNHEKMMDIALKKIPANRLTYPSDIAKFITALATSDESWTTGNIINIDGGEMTFAFNN
jgi:NAD(P)-dependent dehydrogenase (short-subunit alcohol dehydrogenase family)